MKKNRPSITVLMPVYNSEKYLRESIYSILNQTFKDFELLLLFDGSTDGSLEIARSIRDKRMRIVNNRKNRGLVAVLNQGLKLARADLVARMDSDDIALPSRLATQYQYMVRHPDVGICGSRVRLFGAGGSRIWKCPAERELVRALLYFKTVLAHPSIMMRKKALQKCRLSYRKEYDTAEDYALWFHSKDRFPIVNIPKVLLRYRIHGGGISQVRKIQKKNSLYKIYGEALGAFGLDSAENRKTHYEICSLDFVPGAGKFAECARHLSRLRTANIGRGVCDPRAFDRALASVWYDFCSYQSVLGPIALARYMFSNPVERCNLIPCIKLFVKSVFSIF